MENSFARAFRDKPEIGFALQALLWVSVAAAAGRLLWSPIADPDLFWHLASGRWMFEHHRFLGTEVFSHTLGGAPWLNFEPLAQILLRAVERAGGLEGIRFLRAGLSLLAIGLLAASARTAGARGAWAFPLAGLAFLLLGPRLNPRPELFSWVFFGGLVLVVEAARRGGAVWEKRLPWIVGILFLPWVNTHPGYVFGLLHLVAADVGARWAGDRPTFIARLDRAIVVALACVPLTPFGPRIVGAMLEISIAMRHGLPIEEFRPTAPADAPAFWAALLIGGGFIARGVLRGDPEARRWAAAFVGFGVLGSQAVRGVVLIVFPLMPFLGAQTGVWARAKPAAARRTGGVLAFLAVAGIVGTALLRPPAATLLSKRILPVGACRFVRDFGVDGTLYNSYGFGGYIEWALPDRKVFQYGSTPFLRFLEEEADLSLFWPDSDRRGRWADYLDRYGVDYGIVDDRPAPAPESFHPPLMSERLFPEDRWALVYWDDISWVFVKRIPKFEPLIRAREYRALRPARQGIIAAGTLPAPAAAIRAELERHAREVPFSGKGAFLEEALQARSPRS